MLTTLAAVVRTVRRLVRRDPVWTETMLISPHRFIFTVRDAPGREREIQSARTRAWTPVSHTHCSQLPCFEEWHRIEYEQARPYAPNAEVSG